MKVARAGDGARIRLNVAESHVVEQLLDELCGILEPDALTVEDPVQRRLYPDAYDDASDAAAFRELTETALQAERSERVEACLADLHAGRSVRRTEILLDAGGADRWIRVLNDLRLAYGTQLNITEDDDYQVHMSDPDAPVRARYLFLTALQDLLVETLMG
jgi:hypothetical protein